MVNITHEQFEHWCKYWGYTTEEGFMAMCFVANIVGQNLGNHVDYTTKVENDPYRSEAFKNLVKSIKKDAIMLSTLYNNLESAIYNMLETHDSEVNKCSKSYQPSQQTKDTTTDAFSAENLAP